MVGREIQTQHTVKEMLILMGQYKTCARDRGCGCGRDPDTRLKKMLILMGQYGTRAHFRVSLFLKH